WCERARASSSRIPQKEKIDVELLIQRRESSVNADVSTSTNENSIKIRVLTRSTPSRRTTDRRCRPERLAGNGDRSAGRAQEYKEPTSVLELEMQARCSRASNGLTWPPTITTSSAQVASRILQLEFQNVVPEVPARTTTTSWTRSER
ncbi:hypothetical protein EVAR_79022_1, partial [Eumeta japonica]